MDSIIKIQLCDHNLCTGCMACKQKCKHGAISTETIHGFTYPAIITEKCKKCGQCMKVCPILNIHDIKGNSHKLAKTCLAAWNKSLNVRENSSSGGTFSAFAEHILSMGGVVFGAAWNSRMELKHIAVNKVEDLECIRRSKYVQSDVNSTYNQTEKLLKENKPVLYCGTHCQIAGLKFFLKRNYENLYLIDILCQGVPSPLLLKKYFAEIETEYKSKICDCNFRSKKKAWRCGLSLEISLENGRKIERVLSRNEYYNAFYNELFMRESCYNCVFKTCGRGFYSDITLADFWRLGDKMPLVEEDHYEKGISAIIINTPHGKNLFESCRDKISVIERSWEEFATNGGLTISHKPAYNKEALEFLRNHSWHETQQIFFPIGRKRLLYDFLLLLFGEKLLRKVKKCFKKVLE